MLFRIDRRSVNYLPVSRRGERLELTMKWNFIRNNFLAHRLLNLSILAFMTISAVLFAVTVCLTTQLTGSVSQLMASAKTPDFLQMHAGRLDEASIAAFARDSDAVADYQICRFLNLDSSTIFLNGISLSGSTQDNGVCVQSDRFDFLLDMENQLPLLQPGEIAVPVCYLREYQLHIGDTVSLGAHTFTIACFIRDSQMNSMMASSKRFLVHSNDYLALLPEGEEEYLIEFLLAEDASPASFSMAYSDAGLPGNGPSITRGLILMMNALSDGIMIMIILLASLLVLLVALLCIRFIILTGLNNDRREIGTLKALGISRQDIRKLYFSKYLVLAAAADISAVIITLIIRRPLGRQIRELYGSTPVSAAALFLTIAGALLISCITLLCIWQMLKRTEGLSALQALFGTGSAAKKRPAAKWVFSILFPAAAGAMLMAVPVNILHTISSPEFVTYMGIGRSDIRIDIRQTAQLGANSTEISALLAADSRVDNFVRLDTISVKAVTSDGAEAALMAEYGNHTVFPVTYSAGKAPERDGELALSALNASELGLSVGDSLQLIRNGIAESFQVCGIYSDITNGGKTAKVAAAQSGYPQDTVMWSIFYVSLRDTSLHTSWLEEYQTLAAERSGVKISDIPAYVAATFGQTIRQVRLAAIVTIVTASSILFIIFLLFLRLQLADSRNDISLLKALGMRRRAIAERYERDYRYGIPAGIAVGEAAGLLWGEKLTGLLLQSLGADSFHFIISPAMMLITAALLLLVCTAAVKCGMEEIKKIRPAECVRGKE